MRALHNADENPCLRRKAVGAGRSLPSTVNDTGRVTRTPKCGSGAHTTPQLRQRMTRSFSTPPTGHVPVVPIVTVVGVTAVITVGRFLVAGLDEAFTKQEVCLEGRPHEELVTTW